MHQIKIDKNLKIAVEDIKPNGKSVNNKEQKTVLFIHGWPLNHTMFEYQFNALWQKGIRCVAMDLRGFGQSTPLLMRILTIKWLKIFTKLLQNSV